MTDEHGSDAEHGYFFLGNCQMQYLCSVIGAVTTAPRHFLGHPFNVNVTLDGAEVPYVRGRAFLNAARKIRLNGGRTLLLVQETTQRRYHERIAGWGDLFTDILPVPHLHQRHLWPGRVLKRPVEEISDRTIRRLAQLERHEFGQRIQRIGSQDTDFSAAFWEENRRRLRFFHPGHPTGEVFAEVLKALGPGFQSRVPCFTPLVEALARAMGIYQTCSHPISPHVAELHDLPWARTDLYRAWTELVRAEPSSMRVAVDRATSLLNEAKPMAEHDWPIQAHFRASVGKANLALGRPRRGLSQLQQAIIELKGFHPLLKIALNQATRARRFDYIEHLLVEVSPYVVGLRPDTGVHGSFAALSEDEAGRRTLQRVRDRISPDTWMHSKIKSLAESE